MSNIDYLVGLGVMSAVFFLTGLHQESPIARNIYLAVSTVSLMVMTVLLRKLI